jgi:hypothetical protein
MGFDGLISRLQFSLSWVSEPSPRPPNPAFPLLPRQTSCAAGAFGVHRTLRWVVVRSSAKMPALIPLMLLIGVRMASGRRTLPAPRGRTAGPSPEKMFGSRRAPPISSTARSNGATTTRCMCSISTGSSRSARGVIASSTSGGPASSLRRASSISSASCSTSCGRTGATGRSLRRMVRRRSPPGSNDPHTRGTPT